MSKRSIIIILLAMLFIGIISLYSTFAYDEEVTALEDSSADYNLIYSLKESTNKTVTVNANEEKYFDITLTNTYQSNVKYGMYYYLVSPNKMPENVTISLSEDSTSPLESTIESRATKVVSIKINNSSDTSINLVLGALIGFENGNIEDLIKDGEILIK